MTGFVLMPGFAGTKAPEWVLRLAPELGAVCLYARNVESPEQVRRLCDRLHEANPHLVIAIDEEGGDVTRLEAATGSSYPGNLALGAAGDVGLTRAVARAIGLELACAGIDLDLAPVADVNSNRSNPIIGVRSFGSDPGAVAAQTAAWVDGLQSAGVGATVKHFPGHGDTSVDSHVALPVAGADPRDGALRPFEAAFAAHAQAVMSGHIVVPSLDGAAATVSHKVMTGLLREELGFDGLAVSDAVEMKALATPEEGAVMALAAGCDLVCVGGGLADEDAVIRLREAIGAAVRDGRLSRQRLQEAVERVGRFASWRRSQAAPRGQPDRAVGLLAARRALSVDGDVRVGSDVTVIKLSPEVSIAAGAVPWGLEDALGARGAQVRADGDLDAESVVVTVRDLHRHAWQAEEVGRVLARRPDAVVVEMGAPYCRPPGARNYVATMGAARVCAVAAAEVLRP